MNIIPNYENISNFPYLNLVKEANDISINAFKEAFLKRIMEIDDNYYHSSYRKNNYHVKYRRSRTIVTIRGEITYVRTIYVSKKRINGKYQRYCPVDDQLQIPKYDTYMPDVKSQLVSYYFELNSMLKAGLVVGNIINLDHALTIKLLVTKNCDNKPLHALSRQLVYNTLKKIKSAKPFIPEKIKADTIFIMLDEKYVATQRSKKNNEPMTKNKKMIRMMTVYTGYDVKRLNNRQICIQDNRNYIKQFEDFLLNYCDVDSVKQFIFMGDGATWIKQIASNFPVERNRKTYLLDSFHFEKALHTISDDYTTKSIIRNYILQQSRQALLTLLHAINENPNKSQSDAIKYIINNKEAIKRMLTNEAKCSMEGQISHYIAAFTSSRPKAFGIANLHKYVNILAHHHNGINLNTLYYLSLQSNDDQVNINKEQTFHNYSIATPEIPETYTINLPIEKDYYKF